jgi:predicted transcriptional regulator
MGSLDSRLPTPAQLPILHFVQSRGSATPRDYLDHIGEESGQSYENVHCMFSAMFKKGILARTPEMKGHRYRPAVPKAEFEVTCIKNLIETAFAGDVKAFQAAASALITSNL